MLDLIPSEYFNEKPTVGEVALHLAGKTDKGLFDRRIMQACIKC